jgi:hypothetical protein
VVLLALISLSSGHRPDLYGRRTSSSFGKKETHGFGKRNSYGFRKRNSRVYGNRNTFSSTIPGRNTYGFGKRNPHAYGRKNSFSYGGPGRNTYGFNRRNSNAIYRCKRSTSNPSGSCTPSGAKTSSNINPDAFFNLYGQKVLIEVFLNHIQHHGLTVGLAPPAISKPDTVKFVINSFFIK